MLPSSRIGFEGIKIANIGYQAGRLISNQAERLSGFTKRNFVIFGYA
jgi:hypothetical protein